MVAIFIIINKVYATVVSVYINTKKLCLHFMCIETVWKLGRDWN